MYKTDIEELMDFQIRVIDKPDEVLFTEELIPLETEKDFLASDNFYKLTDEGSAFHEKKAKNKTEKKKVRHKDLMHQKYGKPKTRGAKPKRKR